ncbi:MAG: hypothetical protein WBV94_11480 [Blastocatellia bacterium]
MKNLARAVCAAVFLVGLLVFSQAQNTKQAASVNNDFDDIEPALSYIMKSIQYRVNRDGSKQVMTHYTTYHKANGEFRKISYGPTGPKNNNLMSKYSNDTIIYVGLADGVYVRGYGLNTLFYMGLPADKQQENYFRSHKYYINNRDFVRTDTVAELKVYALRQEVSEPESEIEWVEDSYSPKIRLNSLRSIMHFRDGSEVISEVLSVQFTEVPDDLNDDLKNLQISNMEEKMQKQRQN